MMAFVCVGFAACSSDDDDNNGGGSGKSSSSVGMVTTSNLTWLRGQASDPSLGQVPVPVIHFFQLKLGDVRFAHGLCAIYYVFLRKRLSGCHNADVQGMCNLLEVVIG